MAQKRANMQYMDAALVVGAEIDNVSQWCREHGVNRRTFYRHRDRIRAEGRWQPRSTRPRTHPNATPEPVVAEILRLREHLVPDNGADPIRDHLRQIAREQDWAGQGWRVPARSTINRILSTHGLLEPNPRKRPRSSWQRFSYARPRDCYQIDATETTLADGSTVVVFDVLDDCTRTLVACHAAPAETSQAATAAFTAAVTKYGAPAMVLSDNGAAFTGRHRHPNAGPTTFALAVTNAGTRLIHSSPYHPQTCGKVERHHQTLKKWLAAQPHQPTTLTELQTQLDTYRDYYNTRRGHSAIDRHTPHQTWQAAQQPGASGLGGPTHPPQQTDATLHTLTTDTRGKASLGKHFRIRISANHKNTTINLIRNGNHITAYTLNGTPSATSPSTTPSNTKAPSPQPPNPPP